MKVICIDNKDVSSSLTVGKFYQVLDSLVSKWESSGLKLQTYSIINDEGRQSRFNKRFFITIEELREQKLNILGI